MLIDQSLISADERNSNVMAPEIFIKLRDNISRTGLYPPIIVRPKEGRKKGYVALDGHHRLMVLRELGYTEVNVEVWDISEEEATIALATLNRLHGTEDPDKRRQILEQLRNTFSVSDMAKMLPESSKEIEKILRGTKEKDPEQKPEKPSVIKVTAAQYAVIMEAITRVRQSENLTIDQATDGYCMEMIAADYIGGH